MRIRTKVDAIYALDAIKEWAVSEIQFDVAMDARNLKEKIKELRATQGGEGDRDAKTSDDNNS